MRGTSPPSLRNLPLCFAMAICRPTRPLGWNRWSPNQPLAPIRSGMLPCPLRACLGAWAGSRRPARTVFGRPRFATLGGFGCPADHSSERLAGRGGRPFQCRQPCF